MSEFLLSDELKCVIVVLRKILGQGLSISSAISVQNEAVGRRKKARRDPSGRIPWFFSQLGPADSFWTLCILFHAEALFLEAFVVTGHW